MKLSNEMKVWCKQSELRKESCRQGIEFYKRKLKFVAKEKANVLKAIELEKEQIKIIDIEIKDLKDEWRKW